MIDISVGHTSPSSQFMYEAKYSEIHRSSMLLRAFDLPAPTLKSETLVDRLRAVILALLGLRG